MIKEYLKVDQFLDDVWKFRNDVSSFRMMKLYLYPPYLLKFFKVINQYRKNKDVESLDEVFEILKKVVRVPESIHFINKVYQETAIPFDAPINLPIAKCLKEKYPDIDMQSVHDLMLLYTPKKDPILNWKTLTIIISILVSVFLKTNPKIIGDLGIDIESAYEYIYKNDLQILIFLFFGAFSLFVVVYLLKGLSEKRRLAFKLNCLKTATIMYKE